jgi:signal transduction histidine kinase
MIPSFVRRTIARRRGGLIMDERYSATRVDDRVRRREPEPTIRTAIRLLKAARQPTAIGWGPDLQELHNIAFADIIGAPNGSHRVRRPMRELCADLWPRLETVVEGAMRQGESAALDDLLFCNYRHGYAEESYLTCSCNPLSDDQGEIGGVMIAVTETTEHVLSTRRTAALRDIAAAATTARSLDEACRQALAAVADHPADIPFALLYVLDAERDQARLVATAALAPGGVASPNVIDFRITCGESGWLVAAALGTNESVVVHDLLTRFGSLPAGEWPFAPRTAIVTPLTSPGRDEPDAVLVTGVSARHELDASYRTFIDLVAKQIAAAIAGGRVHEDEERHAVVHAAAQLARAKRRARMRALKAKLEERTRLAREIHDTLLQGVTGIALQLGVVLPQVRTSSTAAAVALERIVDLAVATSRDARQAVWDMRPTALGENDFLRAVDTTARRLAAGAPIAVDVTAVGRVRPLPLRYQSVVLRVVQEAVANAARHAHARSIGVRLSYEARQLRVLIEDDGRGFIVETDLRSYEGHWGLLGMHERASGLGGALTVRSAPGRGTTVTLVLPYRRRARVSADGASTNRDERRRSVIVDRPDRYAAARIHLERLRPERCAGERPTDEVHRAEQ